MTKIIKVPGFESQAGKIKYRGYVKPTYFVRPKFKRKRTKLKDKTIVHRDIQTINYLQSIKHEEF